MLLNVGLCWSIFRRPPFQARSSSRLARTRFEPLLYVSPKPRLTWFWKRCGACKKESTLICRATLRRTARGFMRVTGHGYLRAVSFPSLTHNRLEWLIMFSVNAHHPGVAPHFVSREIKCPPNEDTRLRHRMHTLVTRFTITLPTTIQTRFNLMFRTRVFLTCLSNARICSTSWSTTCSIAGTM